MKKPKLMDFFSDNKIAKIPLDEIDYNFINWNPYHPPKLIIKNNQIVQFKIVL